MADGITRINEMMGWETQETIEKIHDWWKKAQPSEFEAHKGDIANADPDTTEYVLSGFEATLRRSNTGGSGTSYVGMVLGYHGTADLMGRQREKAIDQLKFQGIDFVLKNGECSMHRTEKSMLRMESRQRYQVGQSPFLVSNTTSACLVAQEARSPLTHTRENGGESLQRRMSSVRMVLETASLSY